MLTDAIPSVGSIQVLCLYSGGLDSQLALHLLREYGLRVRALTFHHPLSNTAAAPPLDEIFGIPIERIDFTATLARVLMDWSHGLSEEQKVCTLCRAAMLRAAWEYAMLNGYHFLATGDALNHRNLAESIRELRRIDQIADCEGWVLRPLCGALLDETVPEKRKWIQRERLLNLDSRSIPEREALAERYGLDGAAESPEDCRMLDDRFLARVRDLCLHEGIQGKRSLNLLKLGRHFRLDRAIKLIVGRNEEENMRIQEGAELYDLLLYPEDAPGPTGLLSYSASEEHIRQAAALCARYSDRGEDQPVRMRIRSPRGLRTIEIRAASPGEVDAGRI